MLVLPVTNIPTQQRHRHLLTSNARLKSTSKQKTQSVDSSASHVDWNYAMLMFRTMSKLRGGSGGSAVWKWRSGRAWRSIVGCFVTGTVVLKDLQGVDGPIGLNKRRRIVGHVFFTGWSQGCTFRVIPDLTSPLESRLVGDQGKCAKLWRDHLTCPQNVVSKMICRF